MSYNQSKPQQMFRQDLQQLKIKNDEQKRLNMINKCVNSIYNSLINQASSSTLTFEFFFDLPSTITSGKGFTVCTITSTNFWIFLFIH